MPSMKGPGLEAIVTRTNEKDRGHRGVRGPWSLRPWRPGPVVACARRQSPRARASRLGRQSFFFESIVKKRRMAAAYRIPA